MLALLSCAALQGQFTPYPAEIVRYQVPPPPAPTLQASYNGSVGVATWCYWAIANYPAGPSPINGMCVQNASPLSVSNTISVAWTRPRGAASVDLVRTTTAAFNGVCSGCLLLNDSVALSYVDDGSVSPANFNIGSVLAAATADTTIDNKNWATPRLTSTRLWTPQSLGTGAPTASTVLLGDGSWGSSPFALPTADAGSLVCYSTTTTPGACDNGNLFYEAGTLVTPTAFRLGSTSGSGIGLNGAAMDLLIGSLAKAQLTTTGLAMQGSNAVTNGSTTLGSLGTPANGTQVYCTDCAPASNPCTGASTGTMAFRINGAWVCL